MKFFKIISLALGMLVLGNSLVAAPDTSQDYSMRHDLRPATAQRIDIENTERAMVEQFRTERARTEQLRTELEEALDVSLSNVAKTLTFEAGIPFLLRQNSYTQLALYPYLWWYKGARAATEELMVDSIKWLASYVTGRKDLIDCSQSGNGCKVSKFATTVALDIALRSYIVKPCTNKIFGQEKE